MIRTTVAALALCTIPTGVQGQTSTPSELEQRLNETLTWARQELLKPVEYRTAKPREVGTAIDSGEIEAHGVVHLLPLMSRAQVSSQWKAAVAELPAALTIRDRSFSKPGKNARKESSKFRELGRYATLRFDGLNIDAEDIAEIYLVADFSEADNFVMSWSKHGFAQWPLEAAANDGVATYRINTARLAEWRGRPEYLAIGVPQGKHFEIRELRFVPRKAAYPKPAGTSKVMLQKRLSEVIYLHDRTRLVLPLPVLPGSARIAGTVALIGGNEGRLRIFRRDADGEKEILRRSLEGAEKWQDFDVELGDVNQLEGQLTIEATEAADGVVVIGAPVIYTPIAEPQRVLVYLIDTLAATHMSFYGYDRETTPRLHEFAARGTWFANAFANASRTVESVPSMMLSLPAVSTGVRHAFAKVDDQASLLAEDFRDAGYATACFSTNVNAGPRQGLDRGFDSFFDHIAFHWMKDQARTVPIDDVVSWMERHRQRPTFLYVHTAEPHYPYEAPEPFRNRFAKNQSQATVQRRGGRQERAQYDEEVAFADQRFHDFWDQLEEKGLTKGMITVVTSDHGEEFGEHGAARHGLNLHAETIRVPLLIHGPSDLVPARGRIDVAVQLLDVRPTLLDLAGVKTDAQMLGKSLRPLLAGESTREWEERILFASTFQPKPPRYSLTKLPWRLIFAATKSASKSFKLFDVSKDPRETKNVIAQHPQVAIDMMQQLVQAWHQQPRAGRKQPVKLDEGHIEQLRALGYLDGEQKP